MIKIFRYAKNIKFNLNQNIPHLGAVQEFEYLLYCQNYVNTGFCYK